jgi:hypothetical protein
VEVRKKGVVKDNVEKVTVKACGGRAAKVSGKFVYLGTLMSPTARETEEVTKRCQKASGVFGTLRKVWQRRSINDRVKGRLFEAFVSSVLLYNAEVWPLRKQELQRLNRTYTGLMRQLARLGGRLRGIVDISHKAARDALGLPALESLLTQKRLRWVGHALRRAEGDASKTAVLYELQHNKASAWVKLVWADMTIMGWRNIEALQAAMSNRARFREKTDARALSAP